MVDFFTPKIYNGDYSFDARTEASQPFCVNGVPFTGTVFFWENRDTLAWSGFYPSQIEMDADLQVSDRFFADHLSEQYSNGVPQGLVAVPQRW